MECKECPALKTVCSGMHNGADPCLHFQEKYRAAQEKRGEEQGTCETCRHAGSFQGPCLSCIKLFSRWQEKTPR